MKELKELLKDERLIELIDVLDDVYGVNYEINSWNDDWFNDLNDDWFNDLNDDCGD